MMNAVASATATAVRSAPSDSRAANRSHAASAPQRDADVIDFSEAAKSELSREHQPIRTDLVNRVKAEIAAGTYESEDKLNTAIDRMWSEVFG